MAEFTSKTVDDLGWVPAGALHGVMCSPISKNT